MGGVVREVEVFGRDLLERTLSTAAEAAIGAVTVYAADWPLWAGAAVATGLALVKGFLARFVKRPGQPTTASLAPGV